MRERTRIWRLPPCPPYDVEGTESWLSDLAAQGWMLEEDGYFAGVAAFEKKPPAAVRYRLEAAPKQASNWDDNGGKPADEAMELNADYGWEYVARRGQFYIYRNRSPGARELNTDPQVQALALRALQKRQAHNLFASIYFWFLYPLLYFWRGYSLLLAVAEAGFLFVILYLVTGLWMVVDGIHEAHHLQGLKRKLKAGMPLEHDKNWKHGQRRYYGKKLLGFSLALLLAAVLFRVWDSGFTDGGKQALVDYTGELPFATISSFAEGEYMETWPNLSFDYVKQWSNSALRTGIQWAEHADVRRPDGATLQGGLYITYYDARSEWLARALAAAYQRVDRMKARKNYQLLDCPSFGLDAVVAYCNELHFPTVVLRQGNLVLHASFYQTGPDEHLPLEAWVGILADSIRNPATMSAG